MLSDASARDLADYVLGRAGPDGLIGEAMKLIDRHGGQFSAQLGESIANHVAARYADGSLPAAALETLTGHDSALARFVAARLCVYRGESAAALDGFERTLRALASPSPQVLLHRARLLSQQERFAEAANDLQLALGLFPSHSFFIKSEKLVNRLLTAGQWRWRRKAKLALLSSSTTALLAPVIRSCGFRDGLELDIYEGVYGNYRQEILNPASGMYAFRPDLVVILLNHRDLALPPLGGKSRGLEYVAQLRDLWSVLQERSPCHVIQVNFDLPSEAAWGSLEDSLPEGRRRVLAMANLALTEDLPSGVSILDVQRVIARTGTEYWSALQWHSAKQYPAAAALPVMAGAIAAHAASALGLSRKVLSLDLDNTLWHGVVGEDLLNGIRIGPPTVEGEGHLALQAYIKELQQRGVLLAVCSKNNLDDARLPFLKHDAMLLKLDDFAAFAANWNDKPSNLEKIAAELSLGLDSFLHLDDNPLERALMRARLPQVAVPECGNTPWEMLAALERGFYFEAVALTDEDKGRHAAYRSNADRKDLQKSAATLDEFLGALEMVAEHGPVDTQTLTRVTQLINKTNQFNLTTRRYTEEQIRAMIASGAWWTRWFRLADRFGDHGLIGVILARTGPERWDVDTWLMSCRVLGREMEKFMCQVLLTAAQAAGAKTVGGEYVSSEKNALVRDLYPQFGFRPADGAVGEYCFDLGSHAVPGCDFIRDKLPSGH